MQKMLKLSPDCWTNMCYTTKVQIKTNLWLRILSWEEHKVYEELRISREDNSGNYNVSEEQLLLIQLPTKDLGYLRFI